MTSIQKQSRFILPIPNLLTYIGVTFSLVFFLFFIDEGYYSLEWAAHPAAWIVFFAYFILFLIVLLLLDAFTFRNSKGVNKVIITLSIFLLLSFSFVFVLFAS